MTRNRLLIGFAVVVAAFLTGFLPQFLQIRSLRAELARAQRANSLAELRDLAGYLALETAQKNFGIAAGHATRFFDKARQIHDATTEPQLKQPLAEVLAMRDDVTAKLAQGDPAVLTPVQELFRKVQSSVR